MPTDEIHELSCRIVDELDPMKVYLFGSYAYGTPHPDSDIDIYVVMPNGTTDLVDLSGRAYRSVRDVKCHPVDIVVGTQAHFERRRQMPTVEREVSDRGVLLYG